MSISGFILLNQKSCRCYNTVQNKVSTAGRLPVRAVLLPVFKQMFGVTVSGSDVSFLFSPSGLRTSFTSF